MFGVLVFKAAMPEKPGTTKESLIPQAELLINEVNPDNPGAQEDTEYVELFYPGLAPFDLRDYWLVLYNGKNNLAYKVVNLTGHRTDDHGYFLVGSDGVTPRPSIVLPPNTIQNGVDAVALYHSTTASYQTNMALTDKGLVDAVVYKSRGSEKADKLLEVLAPGQSVLHEDDSHSDQDESLSRCHSLRPRNHNSFQVMSTRLALGHRPSAFCVASACSKLHFRGPQLAEPVGTLGILAQHGGVWSQRAATAYLQPHCMVL